MHLLGHVRQVEVGGEGAHEPRRRAGIHVREQRRRLRAVRADRLPDPLDQGQQLLALLANQRAPEQVPELADVAPQRSLRLGLDGGHPRESIRLVAPRRESMTHRERLPKLESGLYLTDGGIETTLVFHEHRPAAVRGVRPAEGRRGHRGAAPLLCALRRARPRTRRQRGARARPGAPARAGPPSSATRRKSSTS